MSTDNGEYVLDCYLDLKRAFETIDIRILLTKLHWSWRNFTKLIFFYILKIGSIKEQKWMLKLRRVREIILEPRKGQ